MFTLTNERQHLLDAAYCFSFDEPMEDDTIRYEQLHMFLNVFPEKIQTAIEAQTLFKQKDLMQQFQEWCEHIISTIGSEMDASYEKREAIVQKFSDTGRRIFSQSLHDAEILLAEQQGTNFVMLLDTSGGFTVETIVKLTFQQAEFEGALDPYYVYDELIESDNCFGLRILSSTGYPYVQSTIYFNDVYAEYYYRPSVYVEPHGVDTLEDYIAALPHDDRYIIVENNEFINISLDRITTTSKGIFAGEHFLGKDFEAARERIYCATFEDPYAHFSEEIAIEELYDAVFGDDQTLKVRAFNTIFARGEEVAHIVNNILRAATVVEDEMYFSIMASHFEKLGCLQEENRVKWDA